MICERAGQEIKKIVVVGDAYVSPSTMAEAAKKLPFLSAEIISLMWGNGDKDEFCKMQTEIEHRGPEAVDYPKELDEAIKEADILLVHFCPIPEKLLNKAERLKLAGVCRGGTENIAVDVLSERKIPLIHIIRNAEAVAEFTLGMMIAETRNISRAYQSICNGIWRTDFPNAEFSSTLVNMKVGVVGLGNIGSLLAKKLAVLGVTVLGYDEYISEDKWKELPVEKMDSLTEIFHESDIISLHLRLTKDNQGIVGKELIEQMKPTSYLVNIARAGLIDENALLDALRECKIAGAALDVFEQEPLPPEHPFCRLDNITLTPHIAGDTVDSIALSPYTLAAAVTEYFETGNTRNVCNKI